MTLTEDRATHQLDRPHWATAPHLAPDLADRMTVPTPDVEQPATSVAPEDRAVPRGWGSHEDRRMMRLAMLAFLVLAVYAVVFVLLGYNLGS